MNTLELIETPLAERVKAAATKRAELESAEQFLAQCKERVKALKSEYKVMVDALLRGDHIAMSLPLSLVENTEPAREERVDSRFAAMAQEMQSAPDDAGGEDDAIRRLRGGRVAIEAASNEGPED